VGVGECLRVQVLAVRGEDSVCVGPGVGVDADDERTCVGDNGVHAIGIPLRETVIAVAADRRRARERSLRGRTVMGHGPFGVGQASYQATEVGRVDAGRPPLSDSSLARHLRGHCCHESRQRRGDRRQPCQPVPDQPGKDSQTLSSRCRDWWCGLVARSVADHGPQDVGPAAGECQQRLFVPLASARLRS
jgi:hypothetical protein